jgi:glutathionylspermidine synthase
MKYEEMRESLYGPLRSVFSWDWLDGEEYGLADIHLVSAEFRQELTFATAELAKIYAKTVELIQKGPDELLLELGVPEDALGIMRLPGIPSVVTLIGRFDFAHTSEGLKMLEFNADTPTSIVEAFFANQKACEFFQARSPNTSMEKQIRQAFTVMLAEYERQGYQTDSIVFSSLGWHEEDKGTTIYLLRQSGLPAAYVPLEDLRVYEDRLWALLDGKMKAVDVLYRLHAIEKLAVEKDEDGYPTGCHVLDLIARKKLAIINPPSAFLAQTKALQVLIWNLYLEGVFYTDFEQDIIARYMLPTYMENNFESRPYVTKPIFGREGGAVTLYSDSGQVIARDEDSDYWEQSMIYQQMADMEQITVNTINGPFCGHILWGSFLIGGEPSAICARIGGKITDNSSCFLPVGLKEDDS